MTLIRLPFLISIPEFLLLILLRNTPFPPEIIFWILLLNLPSVDKLVIDIICGIFPLFSSSSSLSLASAYSCLVRHHDQSRSSESPLITIFPPLVLTLLFPNDLHFLLLLTPVISSRNPSVLFSDSHLLNDDITTDQYSTPLTPICVDYPLIVNNTRVTSPRKDRRFFFLATHKLNSNTHSSDERRRIIFHRLNTTNLEIEFEIADKFHDLSPHPIPSHTTSTFKSIPRPFFATYFIHFVSDNPTFRLLHGSITFLNTLTFLNNTA